MPEAADNPSLEAASPTVNASVHASAGTGKTWLLTTRIVRLLLAGAEPGNILAVTFTRKAAAEMQQRVNQRLQALTMADDSELDKLLAEIGVESDPHTRTRARRLYEESLFSPYAMKATTFHAFCQELLQRFPLEAGIVPGFELIEHEELLEDTARDALLAEAAAEPDGPLAAALGSLVEHCNGLHNANSALRTFLGHRSDWWALTENSRGPLADATASLEQFLDTTREADPLAGFPDPSLQEQLEAFASLLGKHPTKTNTTHVEVIESELAGDTPRPARFEAICSAFFTQKGEPRSRKESKTQKQKMGVDGEARFLELNASITAGLDGYRDRLRRQATLETNLAWYEAGLRLLVHYQRIKREQRLLDFTDLEWKACALLNSSDHAHWVQYKLDNRIDHLLVDEFQDTNPTQWRLLLPLLQELAAGNERMRSVFLVGDVKQSIYGFRRANPELLGAAAGWLEDNMASRRYPLDASRRSAPAVIDCVNAVFLQDAFRALLPDFNSHTTHHADLHGRVELLPLVTITEDEQEPPPALPLRNPLQRPREDDAPPPHYREGQQIAERIRSLVDKRTCIVDDGRGRPLEYGDIIILVRQRTHAASYERALREAGIPYQGTARSMLLDYLEVRDLTALLNLLIAPFDNLALAQVLRSPVFGVDSEALLQLAADCDGSWYAELGKLALKGAAPWPDIHAMLERWRALAGLLPVHDLLDRIYHEAELLSRYMAAFPDNLALRVQASLTRFLELALEVDSGRYPSLPRFLEELERLRSSEKEQPDEATPEAGGSNRVRILTIHGAKGLEAPVIFLADTASGKKDKRAWSALVDWPAGRDRPRHMLLARGRETLDSHSRRLVETQDALDRREEANVLYVALTRARQYLFISGSVGKKSSDNTWYHDIEPATREWNVNSDGNPFIETGTPPTLPAQQPDTATSAPVDPRLAARVETDHRAQLIAPSRTTTDSNGSASPDEDGRTRGTVIHRMLEYLAGPATGDNQAFLAALATSLGNDSEDADLLDWWQEARRVINDPALAKLFDSRLCLRAWNEVPVQYRHNGRMVYGIIDRVVVYPDNTVSVIDYKTHRIAGEADMARLEAAYREQMRLYAGAATRLWPGHAVSACLLFTAIPRLLPCEI